MAAEFPSLPGLLLILGGAIFAVLALLHAWFTFRDIAAPRRLVPDDPAVRDAMAHSGLRLSRGATTMWQAWVGFNFSHSLGVLILGGWCLTLGLRLGRLEHPRLALLLPILVGLCYLFLAIRYWFRTPALGAGVAVGCLALAWLAVAV